MTYELAKGMWGCGRCAGILQTRVTKIDGVTWTTLYCPEHGDVFTSADAGELDLGIVRESKLGGNDFEFFSENFIDHVDTIPPTPSTSKPSRSDAQHILVALIIGTLIGLVIVAIVLLLTGDDPRDDSGSQILTSASAATTPPTVWQTTNLPTALTEPAEVESIAARGPQIQWTEPPAFDPVAFCNDLEARDYRWTVLEPAMDCYRVVASWYGWDDATIEARSTFVFRIMATESAGCWNARRWSYPNSHQESCSTITTGKHDDVGFGQITSVLRPLTCEKAGICSTMQTIESPWNSMLAYVVVLDELGKRPYCYNRNLHVRNGDCDVWPG